MKLENSLFSHSTLFNALAQGNPSEFLDKIYPTLPRALEKHPSHTPPFRRLDTRSTTEYQHFLQ